MHKFAWHCLKGSAGKKSCGVCMCSPECIDTALNWFKSLAHLDPHMNLKLVCLRHWCKWVPAQTRCWCTWICAQAWNSYRIAGQILLSPCTVFFFIDRCWRISRPPGKTTALCPKWRSTCLDGSTSCFELSWHLSWYIATGTLAWSWLLSFNHVTNFTEHCPANATDLLYL